MTSPAAKARQETRRRERDQAEFCLSITGWKNPEDSSAKSKWPLVAETSPIDSATYRFVVRREHDHSKVYEALLKYGDGMGRFNAVDEAIFAYAGLDAETRGPADITVWYYKLLGGDKKSTLHWRLRGVHAAIFHKVHTAHGPVMLATSRWGRDVAFVIKENELIDADLPFHVEWKYLGDSDTNWSSLDSFAVHILK